MEKYYVTLIAHDGNVFDEMKTDNFAEIEEWAVGRSHFYDVFEKRFKKYTVDIAKWSDNMDCYVPYEEYVTA